MPHFKREKSKCFSLSQYRKQSRSGAIKVTDLQPVYRNFHKYDTTRHRAPWKKKGVTWWERQRQCNWDGKSHREKVKSTELLCSSKVYSYSMGFKVPHHQAFSCCSMWPTKQPLNLRMPPVSFITGLCCLLPCLHSKPISSSSSTKAAATCLLKKQPYQLSGPI